MDKIENICPDCKVEMEYITPDDSENYYKCPKCREEFTEEDRSDD